MSDMITEVMSIKCSATTAFDLMADARNEPSWNSGVSQVELQSGEPIGNGSRFRVADKRGQHDAAITTYQRPERLSFSVCDKSMDVEIKYTLSELNGVTTMTGRFNAEGKGPMKFLLPLLVPLIRRNLSKEPKNFIALCEAEN
jgi:hypothetical protein